MKLESSLKSKIQNHAAESEEKLKALLKKFKDDEVGVEQIIAAHKQSLTNLEESVISDLKRASTTILQKVAGSAGAAKQLFFNFKAKLDSHANDLNTHLKSVQNILKEALNELSTSAGEEKSTLDSILTKLTTGIQNLKTKADEITQHSDDSAKKVHESQAEAIRKA